MNQTIRIDSTMLDAGKYITVYDVDGDTEVPIGRVIADSTGGYTTSTPYSDVVTRQATLDEAITSLDRA